MAAKLARAPIAWAQPLADLSWMLVVRRRIWQLP